MKINFTKRQVEVLQIVFDQLCCDHFRDCVGNTPYSFGDEEGEFIAILHKVEESLDR